jgi:putative YhdH/YhfP family quinone oxidoreductase
VGEDFLGPGTVTIKVHYSSANFKDGLAITPRGGVVRNYPIIPGIDLTGEVVASEDAAFTVGDLVIAHGYEIGVAHNGGFAEYARVPAEWVVKLKGLSPREAAALGTAGFTAAMSVQALLDRGLNPGDGPVLVTGATGGVGSVAVAVLAQMGHQVVAATGKASEADYLRKLGAAAVIDRAELAAPGKPLQKERWAGVVDAVGSHTLANACAQVRYGGAVAACGLAQGMDLPATVAPFILRGVALLGVDSVMAPMHLREQAWHRLARDLDPALLETITTEIPLAQAVDAAQRLMAGQVRGRIVVKT